MKNRVITTVLRVADTLSRIRRSQSPFQRRWTLVVAGGLFLLGLAASVNQISKMALTLRLAYLIPVFFIGVPVTTLLNAAEHQQLGRMVGLRLPFADGLRVAVLGTAANLAPVPGSALVRFGDLGARGVKGLRASAVVALSGLLSLSISGVVVSLIPGLSAAERGFGAALGLTAVVASLAIMLWFRSMPWRLVFVEVGLLAITAARLFLILASLGFHPGGFVVLTMAAVYAATAVVGILPGGIGVREGLVAYLGTAGGLAAAAGFAASALDRLLGLAAHMPVALFLASRHVPSPSLDESSDVG